MSIPTWELDSFFQSSICFLTLDYTEKLWSFGIIKELSWLLITAFHDIFNDAFSLYL